MVYYVTGTISRATDARIREEAENSRRHDRCVLVLTTSGGDAVQVSEKDELARFGSGLETVTALNSLAETAFASFENYLVTTVQRSGGQISTKTAAELATNLTVGLVAPISGQIDPIRLGREQRAMEIASAYAERLKVPPPAIARLTTDYPDHGFVIDLIEAREFLNHARDLKPAERTLEVGLASAMPGVYVPSAGDLVICLTGPDAAAVQPELNGEERDEGIPAVPEGDSGEATGEDAGARSPRDQADGTSAQSVPESAHATH